ncbi:MAG: methyltransferase domain-containing protein [Candidatus Rokubacteria bacterium]|nr:methyltransferase domain-containing protein [Candidatus Rokubacteria bacterium]MBI3826170.1 methyltransferase domain-containing protein [Candidatus Rokubacteria bacterium]
MPLARDPFSDLDGERDLRPIVASLEERGRAPSQARLRRRFLRFVPVRPGARVLEVGCGTGVVLRDLAALAGRRGEVEGVDASRRVVAAARRLCRAAPRSAPIRVHVADARALPWAEGRFDAAVAVTLILHVTDPVAVVREMARVVRPGGRVGLQDQDFGTIALTHPDRALTERILRGVAEGVYAEPHSGRRLPGLLRAAGLERVRLLADVYQDITLAPYTRIWLERRATRAVEFGITDAATAQGWLDGFAAVVAAGAFVMTVNYYGAVGVKPGARR